MIPSRTTADFLAGRWELLGDVGGVPRRLLWDNEAGIGRRNTLTKPAAFFAGSLATRFVQLKPRDPESKGIVERANRYLPNVVPTGAGLRVTEGFQCPAAALVGDDC